MEDIKCIKQNATESGDCGNGWEGWRLGNTLYIEYTGSLEYFFQDPYVPDDLMQIDCWDENMKEEIETLIVSCVSCEGLGLGIALFQGWSNLKRIDILAPNAYYGTIDEAELEKIVPYSSWNVDDHFEDIFFNLKKLTEINMLEKDENCTVDGVIYDKECKTLVFCPRGRQGHFSIPEGVEEIDAFAFRDCRNLTSVTIPNSVKIVDMCAFDGCVNLRLTVPDSVTRIGKDAFENVPHIVYHGPAQSDDNWGAKSRN